MNSFKVMKKDQNFLTAPRNFIVFHCLNNVTHTDSFGLLKALKVLAPYGFLSIHRSFCVNKHKISSVSRTAVTRVTLADDSVLTVARRKKTKFLEQFLLL